MADRYPVGVLKDELGNPVGLREFPEGDTLPKSILPPLDYTDTGADPAGTAESLTDDLREEVDLKLEDKVDNTDSRLSDPRTPTGAAGGVLSGTYPNPVFAEDMATQAELDVAINTRTTPTEAANAAPVQTVQGRGGDVVISRSDLNVENVDNTADKDKPVSVAQQAALDSKVDKVVGKGLSEEDYTTAEKGKLLGIEDGATKNTTDAYLLSRANHTGTQEISTVEGLTAVLSAKADQTSLDAVAASKVDKESGKQLSDENYTPGEKNKLASLENFDDSAIQAELDTKVDKVVGKGLSTEDFTSAEKGKLAELESFDDSAIQAELDTKVDKVVGKELSSNDFTDQLRDKLASLEGSHFRGTFPSKAALDAAIPVAVAGDYADVDEAGQDAERYIWDSSDFIWVLSTSKATPLTAAQIKQLYESNPDTNPFDDAAETKLEGIAAGATANSTDAYLLNRANHTGTQEISTVAGLTASLSSKADQTSLDAVSASKVDKVTGKGLSTNDFTVSEKNKLGGIQEEATKNATDAQLRDRATHTGTQPINTVAGLTEELSGKVGTTDPRLSDPRTPTGTAGGVLSGTYPNPTFAVDMATQAELDAVAVAKVDKVAGKGLSTNDYTTTEKNKLSGIATGATTNQTDAYLLSRANHTGVQAINTITGLQNELNSINNLIGDIGTALDTINGEVV